MNMIYDEIGNNYDTTHLESGLTRLAADIESEKINITLNENSLGDYVFITLSKSLKIAQPKHQQSV